MGVVEEQEAEVDEVTEGGAEADPNKTYPLVPYPMYLRFANMNPTDRKNFLKIADIIDISGGLESSGLKDISKIDFFLNNIKQVNNEA